MDSVDVIRRLLALVLVIGIVPALSVWLVIHPFARFWRRLGPVITYPFVVAYALLAAFGLSRLADMILIVDFGFSWLFSSVGFVIYIAAVLIEVQCRRHLALTTLVGLPEISKRRESRLLTEGIYGRIRHPRYAGLVLGTFGFALFVNYLSAYIVALITVPLVFLVVVLEERELRERFGDEWVRYVARVPRFIPRV